MARHFPTNYTKKLKEQDPNEVAELERHKCRTVNDYTDWSELSGPVIIKSLEDIENENKEN